MEVGYLADTDMLQSPFGFDDAWFDGDVEKVKNTQNGLDDDVLSDVPLFHGAGLLFDSEWLTTKFDFSSVINELPELSSYLVTNNSKIPGDDVVETVVEFGSSSDSISSQDTASPDWTSKSMSEEDCPTTPEQHVPNVEVVNKNQEMIDVFDWVMSPGEPLVHQSEGSFFADTMEEDSIIIDQSPVTVKSPASKKTMADCLEPNFNGKTKTPEQKQRKRLQNRTAATRYRSKKRSEQDALDIQCTELEDENKELSKKIESLWQESQYLKNLIVEVFQKKTDLKNERKKLEMEL